MSTFWKYIRKRNLTGIELRERERFWSIDIYLITIGFFIGCIFCVCLFIIYTLNQ